MQIDAVQIRYDIVSKCHSPTYPMLHHADVLVSWATDLVWDSMLTVDGGRC